jgi:hypothetical protein
MYILYKYIFTFFGSGIADGQHDTGRQRGQGAFLLETIFKTSFCRNLRTKNLTAN